MSKVNPKYLRLKSEVEKIFEDLDAYRDWCRFEGKPFNEADLYKPNTTWGKYEAYLRRKNRSARAEYNNNR